MSADYYAVLGVPPDADLEVIKQRYRALVRQHHPDVADDKQAAHTTMLGILQAWNVLKDPDERARYDKSRPTPEITSTGPRMVRTVPRSGTAPRATNEKVRLATMVFEANVFFYDMKNIDDAIAMCRKVLKIDRRNADATSLLGDIFKQRGDLTEARSMYEQAVQMQPGSLLYQQKLDNLNKAAPVVQGEGAAAGGGRSDGAPVRAKGCGLTLLAAAAIGAGAVRSLLQ